MKSISKYLGLLLFSLSVLSACGGGGGGGNPPANDTPIGEVDGTWMINETLKNSNCALPAPTESFNLTVTQNGNDITVRDGDGNVHSGTITGNTLRWSGSYADEAPDGTPGRTNLQPMTATIAADCNSLSGRADWTWTATDGSGYVCSGYTNFEGTRSGAPGCGTPPQAAPDAPTNLSAGAASESSIQLSWQDNSNDEDGFRIYRSLTQNGSYSQVGTVGVGMEMFTDTGLNSNTTYYYYVTAYNNASGLASSSNTASATTMASGPTSPPSTPTGFHSSAQSSSSITLLWDDVTTETGYRLERSTSPSSGYTVIANSLAANTIMYTDTGRASSTTYYYRLVAFNAVGNSGVATTSATTTAGNQPTVPASPSNVGVSNITATGARMTWTDNANNETGFEIGTCNGLVATTSDGRRSCVPGPSGGGFNMAYQVAANVTSYNFTGLNPSTSYAYYIRAFNSAGVSQNYGVRFTTSSAQQTATFTPQYDNLVIINSLDSGAANTVYQTGELAVGCNWSYISSQEFVCGQSLVKFDTSSLSGRTILSATLRLTVDYAGVGFYPRNWNVRALATNWNTNTVTWNAVSGFQYYTASTTLVVPPTYSGQVMDIDVTNTVQSWASGTFNDYGFLFDISSYAFPYDTSLDAFAFFSAEDAAGDRPELIVTYQ